ncbi:MAG: hypothetical protein ACLUTU_17575 [Blautia faecis]
MILLILQTVIFRIWTKMPQWQVAAESEEQTYFDLEYQFVRYERNK